MWETRAILEPVVIENRFRGPPNSGNGGYTCGLTAAAVDADVVEVSLLAPPPLDRPLNRNRTEDGVELRDGDEVIARAHAAAPFIDLEPPTGISTQDAFRAREASPLHETHFFPECFVCGPHRAIGDGLRIICGQLEGRDVVASVWETDPSLPSRDGAVAREIVWAALDCPSGNATMMNSEPAPVVLAALTVEMLEPVLAGETLVAIGWLLGRDGRKLHCASAIVDAGGTVRARARALWIELRQDQLEQWL